MSQQIDWMSRSVPVAQASAATRERFIARTYNHLFGAIVAFALLEIGLFKTGVAQALAAAVLGARFGWLLILGGFVLLGMLFSGVAARAESKPAQYLALGGYVAAEALIFCPLLVVANAMAPGLIASAALVTLVGFAALTGIVFWTRKDFSFLRGVLLWGGGIAFLLIIAGAIFGLQLGMFFSVAMVGLAGASILYNTSDILRRYPEDRYIAAALGLFASVALLFWYVLRIFMSSRD